MIFRNPLKLQVYIRAGSTDMRKSWNGLYGIIKEEMNLDPYNHYLFLFSGQSRKLIKVFYWDGNGFCIWQKKLEKGQFGWPSESMERVSLSTRELNWLLRGIDFRKEHSEINFLK
jgi:transposase